MRLEGPARGVLGRIRVPSDKSVSHRAVILGALARGKTRIRKWLVSGDTLATLDIMRSLGTKVEREGEDLIVEGRDFEFDEPGNVLDAKNSGTTARILMGVLSTQRFFSVITGDGSLRKRPMGRVTEPLRRMGAKLDGREGGTRLPVAVRGGRLRGVDHFNEKSSAQVKSALLIAGLRAEGRTSVTEPFRSRDHTERMLRAFGVEVEEARTEKGFRVSVEGGGTLRGTEVLCPADPSSASFFVALCLLSGGELTLEEVLVNPTRDGFFRKVKEMGAEVRYENLREVSGEPVADVYVRYSGRLRGVGVTPEEVPGLIDEIPVLAVLMALAEGTSEVKGAGELRFKESDRIRAVVENLRSMGAKVEEFEDGFVVEGVEKLRGSLIRTYSDHRIAMAFTVAGLVAEGETVIDDPDCVRVSYPGFFEDLRKVIL
ncbi:MAG: 3-phosphoshikimate 1-carboxyvinyltransferase [Aquificota bacterium]|nr:3-phosphoshikimate 1-carboxyvinyltransferase [Aquificota bacterium]